MAFNRIAYERLSICNPVSRDAIAETLTRTDLKPGEHALDLGCGNGFVAIAMAQAFGLSVEAVERDPDMAALAADRIRQAKADVILTVADSSTVLERAPSAGAPPPRLITVLGATDAAAPGLRDPAAVFVRLRDALVPGGWILWGEPFWKAEPSAPFRQIIEITNHYQTDDGWREAAAAAGLEVVHVRHSTDAEWDAYVTGIDAAVRGWAAANPDAPETPRLLARAEMQKSLFEGEGRRTLGFGLYLLRRPI